jgi:phage shock protein PspC (stress-responsive transcriptional regulator)
MHRKNNNKILGGVLSGIASALGVSAGLIRVIFLVGFFAIGGITFGISSGAMFLIYILLWIFLPAE